MESQVHTVVEYVLMLNEQEAMWLRGLVQNPINEQESAFDQDVRSSIWKALTPADAKTSPTEPTAVF